jgi:hypothetical protein
LEGAQLDEYVVGILIRADFYSRVALSKSHQITVCTLPALSPVKAHLFALPKVGRHVSA